MRLRLVLFEREVLLLEIDWWGPEYEDEDEEEDEDEPAVVCWRSEHPSVMWDAYLPPDFGVRTVFDSESNQE